MSPYQVKVEKNGSVYDGFVLFNLHGKMQKYPAAMGKETPEEARRDANQWKAQVEQTN